jgi:hypothetical protein
MPAEVSSNMARFDGVKYGLHQDGKDLLGDYLKTRGQGFGPEVRRRILIGTYVLSTGYYDAYYNKSLVLRQKITEDFRAAFAEVDAIATPTAPYPAFKIGGKSDPLSMYLADVFTRAFGHFSVSGRSLFPWPAATITQHTFLFIKSTSLEVLFIIEKRGYSQIFILVPHQPPLKGQSYQIYTASSDALF